MKRVLMVTYSFPPMLNMAALRLLRFTENLGGAGWQVDVLTARESRYGVKDPGLLDRVPEGVRVFRESASPDHLHVSARRRTDERASDEGRCHRVPHQAIPRSGPP